MAYRNGRLPASALTRVQISARAHLESRAYLEKAAAARFKVFRAEVRRRTGTMPVITKWGAYRSIALQLKIAGSGHHNYNPGGSVHGFGRCVDIWNHGIVGLVETAARYGFRRTIASEPWHFEYRPEWDPAVKK